MKRLPRFTLLALVLIGGFMLFQRFARGGESLSPEAFVEAYEPGAVLLDVRSPEEFASGHLEGAVNINVSSGDFRERVASLPKDAPVYVYCASGVRSGRAATILEDMGRTDVYNVGGIGKLSAAGAAMAP